MMILFRPSRQMTRRNKEKEGWKWRIQIIPLICSEKCPAQRSLTLINPATTCYRCSGRSLRWLCVCVCACVRGKPSGVADGGTLALSAGLRHQFNLSAHYPPRPGWGTDKCTLGPQAKLIHLPSFFFRRRSGSCWEAGGRSYKMARGWDSRAM